MTIPFTVREPTEREAAALQLFRMHPVPERDRRRYLTGEEAIEYERRLSEQRNKVIDNYKRIVTEYSDTPYAPWASYYIGRIQQVEGEFMAAAQSYQELLARHPDFPLKPDVLYYLAHSYADADEKAKGHEVVETIKAQFPNHLFSLPTGFAMNSKRTLTFSKIKILEQKLQD